MDLEERKDESGDSQKYEKLYQRDREMSEFIDTFPAQKTKVRQQGGGSGIFRAFYRDLSRVFCMTACPYCRSNDVFFNGGVVQCCVIHVEGAMLLVFRRECVSVLVTRAVCGVFTFWRD